MTARTTRAVLIAAADKVAGAIFAMMSGTQNF